MNDQELEDYLYDLANSPEPSSGLIAVACYCAIFWIIALGAIIYLWS